MKTRQTVSFVHSDETDGPELSAERDGCKHAEMGEDGETS